jgi:hypothetical protein
MHTAIASLPNTQETPRSTAQNAEPAPPHPRKFDRATYNKISGLQARLLELLDYDCRQQAKKSPTGARYSLKPEAWFARCLSVSRETISINVCQLEDLGILEITRRAPVRGRWQTNMYKFRSWVWWRLAKALRSLRKTHHRVSQPSHLSLPKKVEETRKESTAHVGDALVGEILARWAARGEPPRSASN